MSDVDVYRRAACQLMDEPIYPFAKETGVEVRFHVHTLKDGEKEIVARRLRAALEEGA